MKKIEMKDCDCERGRRDGADGREVECDRCDWEDRCLECGDFDPYGARASTTMCQCKHEHFMARLFDSSKRG